jgi:lipoate-protein ligase A
MAPSQWRLIRSGFLSGARNMALDEALLESVAAGRSAPVLRLYRWRPATVTLGYAQRCDRSVNLAACREMGLDVVRRITGGRAVLHDREVTYAVIAPERTPPFPGGILENYRVIARPLQRTLAAFGLPVAFAPGRRGGAGEGAAASACFTAPSAYELVCHGRKVTGGAQKRQGGAFLQHGSIPLDLDLERLCRALQPAELSLDAVVSRLEQSVGWLNRWRQSPVAVTEVEERLVEAFAEEFGISLVGDSPTADEEALATRLEAEKYANPAWNWR